MQNALIRKARAAARSCMPLWSAFRKVGVSGRLPQRLVLTLLGSTCLCRPLYKVPAGASETPQPTPATSAVPASSPAPGKVQKNGRRQSAFQAAPENIAKALESIPDLESHKAEKGTPNHLFSYPRTPAPTNSHTPLPDLNLPNALMSHTPVSNGNATPQKASCCSAKSQPPVQVQSQGSCCGGSNPSVVNGPKVESTFEEPRNVHPPQMNGMTCQPSSTPQISPWPDFSETGQGHFMDPFSVHPPQAPTPAYFPESSATPSTRSMGFQSQDSHNFTFPQTPLQPLVSSNSQKFAYTPPQAFGDSSHDCNCGDDCQCLGCATHPFNNTTTQHVQEMGTLVSLDGEEPNPGTLNNYQNSFFSDQPDTSFAEYSFPGIGNPIDTGAAHNSIQAYPHQTATSDLSNGYSPPAGYPSDQQFMTPSEYYTLEYSIGLPNPCTDVTGSCQCGSDCSCVGCLTHSGHNGLSLEPGAMENPTSNPTQPSGSGLGQPDVALSRIPVLDDLSVPSSSPHAIEP